MPIRINNYAGRFGWNMRKYLPKLASTGYLTLQYMTRGRGQQKYIDWFMSQEKTPYPGDHQSLQQYLCILHGEPECGEAPVQKDG